MVFSQDNRYRYTMDRTNNGDTQLTVLYNDKSSKKYKRNYLPHSCHVIQRMKRVAKSYLKSTSMLFENYCSEQIYLESS